MRIDQDLSIGALFHSFIMLIVCASMTVMVPYLFIDQYLKGNISLLKLLLLPVVLILIALVSLLSIFILTYRLPRSIVLEKDRITLINPRFFLPWRKNEVRIPLKEIARMEHHDKRLYFFTRGGIVHEYHVQNLKRENLERIASIKDHLRKKGIGESDRNDYELVRKKENTILQGEYAGYSEIPIGTTFPRYHLSNWRALAILLLFVSIPTVFFMFMEWAGDRGANILDVMSSFSVLTGLAMSFVFGIALYLIAFVPFYRLLKGNRYLLGRKELVIVSKLNFFSRPVENRIPLSAIRSMSSVIAPETLSLGSRYFRGSWRFPPKHAMVLGSIPVENLFRIDLKGPIGIMRTTGEIMRKDIVIERIETDRIIIDLDPIRQGGIRRIINDRNGSN